MLKFRFFMFALCCALVAERYAAGWNNTWIAGACVFFLILQVPYVIDGFDEGDS